MAGESLQPQPPPWAMLLRRMVSEVMLAGAPKRSHGSRWNATNSSTFGHGGLVDASRGPLICSRLLRPNAQKKSEST
jgi:hypothetical protein